MTTRRISLAPSGAAAMLTLWTNRALEALWLLAVALVPLAFLDRDDAISEAAIAYVELPKIALLRTLATLMGVLWLIEWWAQGRVPFESLLSGQSLRPRPAEWPARLLGWLRERPIRWLMLAAWFYLGTTLLSTILSGSFSVSLWGEIPGQDGYPAYTIAAYVLLFAVVATHLKTRSQLWRLLGAVIVTGTLVSGYAILQHYGRDFLNLTEQTGGGAGEVTAVMGNSLFAGAALMMVVPITLMAAILSFREPARAPGPWWKSYLPLWPALVIQVLWSLALAVQFLGITFTFARGPWVGMITALAGFLGLALVFAGWQMLVRAALSLGLTMAFGVAVLQGLSSISILGAGPWLAPVIALAGVLGLAAALVAWTALGRTVLTLGVATAIVVVAASGFLASSWLKGGPSTAGEAAPGPRAQVVDQFASIKTEVLSGFVSGRATHWKASWQLFRDRPWFEFDTLSIPWLRPLIGYGPDLFRYTYLLRSPNEGPDLLPLEPDHAHNLFITHAVEQGFLGLLSSLGIFAASFLLGAHFLIRKRQDYSMAHRLVLLGLLATLAGRFLEMMVGVARVSDLTIFWALFAAFAALPAAMQPAGPATEPPPPGPSHQQRRRSRRRGQRDVSTQARTTSLRSAVVAVLVLAIILGTGWLTWSKTVNNVRAAATVGDAAQSFQRGNFQAAMAGLNRAIELAPDVSVYYNYRANVYLAFQFRDDVPPERECSGRADMGYKECLAFRSFGSNLEGVSKRPYYYRSHLALANSAYNLRGTELIITGSDNSATTVSMLNETARYYWESLALVPNSWRIRNELADAYLEAGQPDAALKTLEESLSITRGTPLSGRALFLQTKAYRDLGLPEQAFLSLDRYLEMAPSAASNPQVLELMQELALTLGRSELAAMASFLVGTILQEQGLLDRSAESFERAAQLYADLGLASSAGPSYLRLAEVYLRLGEQDKAAMYVKRGAELDLSASLSDEMSRIFLRIGQIYQGLGQLEQSAQSLERSLELAPAGAFSQQAHQKLAEVYTSLGRTEQAEKHREPAER